MIEISGLQHEESQERESLEFFLIVQNTLGIHVRPAGVIVKALQNENNEVIFCYNEQEINAKSILGILMLGAPQGARILVKIKGKSTQETRRLLQDIFENKFGEA